MAKERERKFLVHREKLPPQALEHGFAVEAGYFTQDDPAIRVTRRLNGNSKICFKSGLGEERDEFEYVIPNEDAEMLLQKSPTYLSKTRYDYQGWEIDCITLSPTQTLWMAEWEEHDANDIIPTPLPEWIGSEVTHLGTFTNQGLAWIHGRRK